MSEYQWVSSFVTPELRKSGYCSRLARALAGVINIFDPDAVVLGGGLSNIPGLTDTVRPQLWQHVFSDSVETALLTPAHGDSSGVRGAAFLWPAKSGGAA